ncbi:MAG: hypothetical protein B7733_19990 [Myxococcales bacterium FL481]|nr:MAG: hypothetical protein B7733_19990 [Myxococcales bacterium FL481]
MSSFPHTQHLERAGCPRTFEQLLDVVVDGAGTDVRHFQGLLAAVRSRPSFFEDFLPFLYCIALEARDVLPSPMPALSDEGEVSFDERQCASVLANAFFCTFVDRVSENCRCADGYPSINFDELYEAPPGNTGELAKMKMLFDYFDEIRRRRLSEEASMRRIRFLRRRAKDSSLEDWLACDTKLLAPRVYPLGRGLEETTGMLRVDFANRLVGGAAIAYGSVQEEIMFCEHPEMLVARLICPPMEPDEAIFISGAQRFSTHTGYARTLDHAGPFPPENNEPDLWVVAIDALPIRSDEVALEFSRPFVLRELTKARAGFEFAEPPTDIATGNWGCGAFGGDVRLKSLIQWLAASRSGKQLHYFPFDSQVIAREFAPLATMLTESGRTVGDLAQVLLCDLRPGNVYDFVRARLSA